MVDGPDSVAPYPLPVAAPADTPAGSGQRQGRHVLVILLDPIVDDLGADLLRTLGHHYTLTLARSSEAAVTALTSDPPSSRPDAALITSAELIRRTPLCKALSTFTYDDGGTTIFGGAFSSFVRPQEFGRLFARYFGKRWGFAAYHRETWRATLAWDEMLRAASSSPIATTTTQAITAVARNEHLKKVPREFSVKAVSVTSADPGEKLFCFEPYCDSESSDSNETHKRNPEQDLERAESCVCFGRYGRGWVGYLGDVNFENSSTAVIVALCGVGKGPA